MQLYGAGNAVTLSSPGAFYSYSVPANTLADNGDALLVEFGFRTNGTGTTTEYSLVWGGTTIVSYAAFNTNGDDGIIRAVILRTGATSQRLAGTMLGTTVGGAVILVKNGFAAGGATLSGAVTVSANLASISGGNEGIGNLFSVTLFQV